MLMQYKVIILTWESRLYHPFFFISSSYDYTSFVHVDNIYLNYHVDVVDVIIESLSNSVFERRTSTGSGLFASLGSGLVQTLGQIVFIREKKLSNTNLLESRHIKEKKTSLPVDVRRSKTSLLKLLIAL